MSGNRKKPITESEFNMWRAVCAFSLVDHILSIEEQKLLKSYLRPVRFTREQIDILKRDFEKPQDVEALYRKITDPRDRERFCILARALAWCEGAMDRQEEIIIQRLSCLANDNVLTRTRRHPHLEACYSRYAKAGVLGLFRTPPLAEVRI